MSVFTTGILSRRNRSVWHIYAVPILRLIQSPGRDNSSIGNAFVDLIDDAFERYHQFQDSNDFLQYVDWAKQFTR